MAIQELQTWYVRGLQTLVAAAEASEGVAAENAGNATSPELRGMLEEGARIAGTQTGMIKDLLRKAGGESDDSRDVVLDAIIQAGRVDIAASGDPAVVDVAIVATTRVGLHYYIAAYGTIGATAKHLQRDDDAATIAEMVGHVKQKDEEYVQLTELLLSDQIRKAG